METLRLQVTSVRDETPSIRSISLSLGGRPFSFKPGQYCLVQLATGDGGEDDRPLSIASSPTRTDSLVFATRRSDSAFKQAFFKLKTGDSVTVNGPTGRFVYDGSANQSVFLSGGIGITPLKSMIEYAAETHPDHRIVLLYGNRSPEEIAFRAELDAVRRDHGGITIHYVVAELKRAQDRIDGTVGKIDEALIQRHVSHLEQSKFYLCGPPGMVRNLTDLLSRLNVPTERIVLENFDGYE